MADQDPNEVSDSTDWLATPLPGLANVESALRCQVCKDFYKTPMVTSCNHTFCSLCIRRALSSDGKCPLCRANEQEIRLRSNWSMEEVVGAFAQTRPSILQFARKPPVVQRFESPKRRSENDYVDDFREPKRLRSSARLSASKGAHATAEMVRQEADMFAPEQEEVDYDDGLVACPICLTRMKEAQVDRHLDKSCPGSPQPESRRRPTLTDQAVLMNEHQTLGKQSAVAKRPERLPTVNYSSFRDPQLRKKLAELGISTFGDRKMLERRHREWMTVWNANCDALHPRKKGELLQDLNIWENTLGSRAPTASRSINLGAQIKDKDFDHQAWSTQHDSSFRDLIANARKNVAKTKQQPPMEHSEYVIDEAAEDIQAERDLPISHNTIAESVGTSPHNPIGIDDSGLQQTMPILGSNSGMEKVASKQNQAEPGSAFDRLASQIS